jgi:hypothetical protein
VGDGCLDRRTKLARGALLGMKVCFGSTVGGRMLILSSKIRRRSLGARESGEDPGTNLWLLNSLIPTLDRRRLKFVSTARLRLIVISLPHLSYEACRLPLFNPSRPETEEPRNKMYHGENESYYDKYSHQCRTFTSSVPIHTTTVQCLKCWVTKESLGTTNFRGPTQSAGICQYIGSLKI